MQDFEGDIFYLIQKAEEYILKNIHIGMKLEGLRRLDVPEIDKEAFREAIINAFCHRDYREFDSVNIAVFKDRVEIRSPGLLYGGLTIEAIRTKMVSERRNELIAEMFHRVHFIEKWGRGISLILSKEPDAGFSEVGTKFITTFKRKSYTEGAELSRKSSVKKGVEKGVESMGKGLVEGLADRLAESQKQILQLVKDNPYISKKELSEIIGISTTAIDKNIVKLKKEGLLKRVGPAKGGHWEIVE